MESQLRTRLTIEPLSTVILRDLKETIHAVNPSPAQLRRFGVAFALFLTFFAYRFGIVPLYYAAAFSLAMVIVFPRFFRPIYFLLALITFPIGWMVSRIFLIIFFFVIITPTAVVRRLLGYDHLKLTFGGEKTATYWENFEENANPHSMGL